MPDTTYNLENTIVFLTFPSTNSVTRAVAYHAATRTYSMGNDSRYLPIGTKMKLVVMSTYFDSTAGYTYKYYQDTNVIITENIVLNANPVTLSLDSVKYKLSEL